MLNGLLAAQFSRQAESYISMKLDKEDLAKDFEISLKIRTYDQDGLLFASIVSGAGNRGVKVTEDIGYYDYRPVTLLFACFISFQRYGLS